MIALPVTPMGVGSDMVVLRVLSPVHSVYAIPSHLFSSSIYE